MNCLFVHSFSPSDSRPTTTINTKLPPPTTLTSSRVSLSLPLCPSPRVSSRISSLSATPPNRTEPSFNSSDKTNAVRASVETTRHRHVVSLVWRLHCLFGPTQLWLAEHLPQEEESITTLAHAARGVTEKKWHEHLAWVKERCHGKRYYHLKDSQRTDPVASRAREAVASRFYQLRIGTARIGPYLAMVGQAENDKCWWCRRASGTSIPISIQDF
jgi:hypothetical protein